MLSLAPDAPLTNDDSLAWKMDTRGGVTRFTSTFETMRSATIGLNLSLEAVLDDLLPWLSMLAPLLDKVGVIHEGAPLTYDDVRDRLRREILALNVSFSTNVRTGRAELEIDASGGDVEEAKRAVGWAREFLSMPDLRAENLPRLRDVLEEELTRLHNTMSETEGLWVERTAEAYRRQDQALLLHTRSPLTRVHDAFITSWQLEGGDGAAGVSQFLQSLAHAGATMDRTELRKLTGELASKEEHAAEGTKVAPWLRAKFALASAAQARVRKAGRDLGHFLDDLPDASLASDWAALCREMAIAVARPPQEGIDALRRTLDIVRHRPNARVWTVGSSASERALTSDIDGLVASLEASSSPPVHRALGPRIAERALARGGPIDSPFVGLVNASTGSASLVASAPSVGLDETRAGPLLDFLAVNIFTGAGSQSFYKRIWGAGLAYSGYVYQSADSERKLFYSDRCASLPQLLQFVDAQVRNTREDPRLVDYAVASGFRSRAAEPFETRARSMASDLEDGETPARVAAFRTRLLAMRGEPHLASRMHARVVPAMTPLIPSLSPTTKAPTDTLYFVVGAEPTLSAYEQVIQRTSRGDARVLRLWPRDFWDVR
jgi:hypothetical protein